MSVRIFLLRLMILVLFCGSVWLGGLLYFVRLIPTQSSTEAPSADAIVVLTGGKYRVEEGISLLQQERAPMLFISGVHVDVKRHELFAQIQTDPAFRDRVFLGYHARSTMENGLEVSEWARRNHVEKILLVTANYHMPRSELVLSIFEPELEVVPYPVFPDNVEISGWWGFPGTRELVLSEYHKWLLTYVQWLTPRS